MAIPDVLISQDNHERLTKRQYRVTNPSRFWGEDATKEAVMNFLRERWLKLSKTWQNVLLISYYVLMIAVGAFQFYDEASGIILVLVLIGVCQTIPNLLFYLEIQSWMERIVHYGLFGLNLILLAAHASGWVWLFAAVGLTTVTTLLLLLCFTLIGGLALLSRNIVWYFERIDQCWNRWVREPLNRRATARWERKLVDAENRRTDD